ncbi:MAG: PEGA domain-containing protein, partial [Kofleriaceae bacterium]
RIAYAAHLASPAPRPGDAHVSPPGVEVFPLDALPPPMSTGVHHAAPLDEPVTSAVAWFDGVSAPVDANHAQPLGAQPYSPDHPYGIQGYDPNLVPIQASAYPTIDPALYHRPDALPEARPPQRRAQPRAAMPRWVVIAGTAAAAIVVAIIVARMARGSGADAAPSALASHATPTSATTRSPSPVHVAPRAGSAAPGSRDPKPLPPAPATESLAGEDDGEAIAGGTPSVGSGPCKLTVSTTPAGSIVRLDDQPVGPSPITIEGTCDKHKIDVAHARYQGSTRWVTLAAGKPQDLDISLPRPIHAVTVTSFPPGAELSIDGHRAGTPPTIVQMMGFASVNLTFTKAGFQSVTKKVYSKSPQDHVFVKLAK